MKPFPNPAGAMIYLTGAFGDHYFFEKPTTTDPQWYATAKFGRREQLKDPEPSGLMERVRLHFTQSQQLGEVKA